MFIENMGIPGTSIFPRKQFINRSAFLEKLYK